MADLEFQISYSALTLPAWEASRTLRGITHLYYYSLLAQNDNYSILFNKVYQENGRIIPEDLTKKLDISESDQLFLEVQSLSPRLTGKASSRNENAAKNASDAMQILKRLREEVSSKGMTDREKIERIEGSKEIQQQLLEPIQTSKLDDEAKGGIRRAALFACLSFLAETIESIELFFRRPG